LKPKLAKQVVVFWICGKQNVEALHGECCQAEQGFAERQVIPRRRAETKIAGGQAAKARKAVSDSIMGSTNLKFMEMIILSNGAFFGKPLGGNREHRRDAYDALGSLRCVALLLSSVARRDDSRLFNHQDDCLFRSPGSMDDASGYYKRLTWRKVDGTVFEIDQQSPRYDIEKFIVPIVFVPMVLAFDDPNPNNGIIYLAQCLIKPWKVDCFRKLLDINHFKRLM
jgi:hypothetical protein